MSRRENLKAEIHSSGLSFPPTKVENCISSWKALSKRDFPEGEKSFHFPKLEKRVSLTLGCSFCCAFLADFFSSLASFIWQQICPLAKKNFGKRGEKHVLVILIRTFGKNSTAFSSPWGVLVPQ